MGNTSLMGGVQGTKWNKSIEAPKTARLQQGDLTKQKYATHSDEAGCARTRRKRLYYSHPVAAK